MKVIITVECDNAAFGETELECGEMLREILAQAGDKLAEDGPSDSSGHHLRDGYGNTVGRITVER